MNTVIPFNFEAVANMWLIAFALSGIGLALLRLSCMSFIILLPLTIIWGLAGTQMFGVGTEMGLAISAELGAEFAAHGFVSSWLPAIVISGVLLERLCSNLASSERRSGPGSVLRSWAMLSKVFRRNVTRRVCGFFALWIPIGIAGFAIYAFGFQKGSPSRMRLVAIDELREIGFEYRQNRNDFRLPDHLSAGNSVVEPF